MSSQWIEISSKVQQALAEGRPVVALESTVFCQGLPAPTNLEMAFEMEEIIRQEGAVPATMGVIEGRIHVGLSATEIERLADAPKGVVAKLSTRDLPDALVKGRMGATTVSATTFLAARTGIRFFATGGIGGVHRGVEKTFDISADLAELARSPVAVISSGAKTILDLGKTLEHLESLMVPVVGYQTDQFPAFYSRESSHALSSSFEELEDVVRFLECHWELGLKGALIANPIPADAAIPRQEIEEVIANAIEEAGWKGIEGQEVTPFLLQRIAEATKGRTIQANCALLRNNAHVAAQLACQFTSRRTCII